MPLTVQTLPVGDLSTYYQNPRRGRVDAIAESLTARGQYKPIVVNVGTLTGRPFEVLAGNHTLEAARSLGWETIDVVTVDLPDDAAAQVVLADNRIADLGDYDDEVLAAVLEDAVDLTGTGYTDTDLEALLADPTGPTGKASLAVEFGAVPLTVLSARAGEWQERKKAWMSAGLRSEEGRDEALVYDSPQARFINWYKVKNAAEAAVGHDLTDDEVIRTHREELRDVGGGTSVFDPALAEILLSWFSAPGARVVDPWAGGAVRGVVAAALGREYFGVELRREQIEANVAMMPVVKQAVLAALGDGDGSAEWVAGTVGGALGSLPDGSFDLAFSAPPVYTGDEKRLTPVQRVGAVLVKRDDMFSVGASRGGKVRTCLRLAEDAKAAGATRLVTAGSRQSPQVAIVADVAAALGMECEAYVPDGPYTPELVAAEELGARIIQDRGRYNTVLSAHAREAAAAFEGAVEIPFGMETPLAVELTAEQVANVPDDVKRIVMPVGSGMSLAGVLHGLARAGRTVPVLGVTVGADPTSRLDEYAPEGWRDVVTLVPSGLDYHDPAPSTKLGPIGLDPIYEAKTLPFLRDGDLLWVVGIRGSVVAVDAGWVDPTWMEGDSTARLSQEEPEQFDMALGCPPYYNLETYSDDPRDLSNMSTAAFDAAMVANMAQVARVLRDDSYAVFVVGNVRDRRGLVLDMRRCMSEACEAAGMRLVNDAVLLTPVGSAAMRAGRQFRKARTLGRVHQEVLVYVKGDRKKAAARLGPVSFGSVREVEEDVE